MRMSFSKALTLLLELARDNQLDEDSINGDDCLEGIRRWQELALDALERFISEIGQNLDRDIVHSKSGFEADFESLQPEPRADPTIPSTFMRIALSLGRDAAIDPVDAEEDEWLMKESQRQQRAIELVEALIARHGEQLNEMYGRQHASVPKF